MIHTAASVLALISGGTIFFMAKGTPQHKKMGYVYSVSMLIVLVTSFFIFDLFGQFGVYHALSIVSFVTLMIALAFPIFGRKNKNWIEHHMIWMGYSYVGLVMAGGSHLFSVFPEWSPTIRMILFWGLPYAIGSYLIFTKKKGVIKKAAENMQL